MKNFTKHKTAVIIGAGPAGLTAAYELLKRTDIIPIVVEESSQMGGIARTINHNGNRMDIGGHRFFSKNDDIMKWWLNILPLQGAPAIDEILTGTPTAYSDGPDPETTERVMLSRRRISRIAWRNKFFNYPVELTLEMLRNMGFATSMKVAVSFAWSHVFKREERSLEDFYINRFGKQLYQMFFENYTTKVWGKHPSQLNADWGAQRVNKLSLASVIKNMLHKPSSDIEQKGVEKSLINRFIYPKLGPGQLWETVAHAIEDMGGTIITNCCAQTLNCAANNEMESVTVKHKNGETQTINCDYVFSSMPLTDLVAGIRGIEVPTEVRNIANHLPYRDFITVGILVDNLLVKNNTRFNTYAE
ncbi:MAG: NAD(P)-binding protein, partial [Muribaculaceae bacterium]